MWRAAYGDQPPGWTGSAESVKLGGVKLDLKLSKCWGRGEISVPAFQPGKIKLSPFLLIRKWGADVFIQGVGSVVKRDFSSPYALATQFTASYWPLPLLALTFWFSSCPFDSSGAGFCLPQAIRYLAHAEHDFKLFSSVSRAQHGNITLALRREKKNNFQIPLAQGNRAQLTPMALRCFLNEKPWPPSCVPHHSIPISGRQWCKPGTITTSRCFLDKTHRAVEGWTLLTHVPSPV